MIPGRLMRGVQTSNGGRGSCWLITASGAGEAGEQRNEGRLDGDEDASGVVAFDLLGVADELDRVAFALLGFQQERAAGERRAIPDGLWVLEADDGKVLHPAIVFAPAAGIVSRQEQDHRAAADRGFIIGLELNGRIEVGQGVGKAAGFHERGGILAVTFGVSGLQLEGGIEVGERSEMRPTAMRASAMVNCASGKLGWRRRACSRLFRPAWWSPVLSSDLPRLLWSAASCGRRAIARRRAGIASRWRPRRARGQAEPGICRCVVRVELGGTLKTGGGAGVIFDPGEHHAEIAMHIDGLRLQGQGLLVRGLGRWEIAELGQDIGEIGVGTSGGWIG